MVQVPLKIQRKEREQILTNIFPVHNLANQGRGYYCPKSIVLDYKFTAGEESALSTYHKSGISQEVANTQCDWCFMATSSIDE